MQGQYLHSLVTRTMLAFSLLGFESELYYVTEL